MDIVWSNKRTLCAAPATTPNRYPSKNTEW